MFTVAPERSASEVRSIGWADPARLYFFTWSRSNCIAPVPLPSGNRCENSCTSAGGIGSDDRVWPTLRRKMPSTDVVAIYESPDENM